MIDLLAIANMNYCGKKIAYTSSYSEQNSIYSNNTYDRPTESFQCNKLEPSFLYQEEDMINSVCWYGVEVSVLYKNYACQDI